MVSCPIVSKLWQDVREYAEKEYQKELELSPVNIISNVITQPKSHVLNFICLVTKQYIYSQRCLKKMPLFNILVNIINRVRNIEKFIAIKNNRQIRYYRKWTVNV